MKSDEDLQKNVQAAIKWEPLLIGTEITVTALDGIITLNGIVNSYAKKIEAEGVVRHVAGVKDIIEKIEIKLNDEVKLDDEAITRIIVNALHWNWGVSDTKLTVKVKEGWVTLEGEQQWHYQKEAAKNAVINLTGVKGVTNNITLKTIIHDEIEKKDVERALGRNWSMNNLDVRVEISGNRVTLSGTVHSFFQKYEAEKIVFKAPGVWTVNNQLTIDNKKMENKNKPFPEDKAVKRSESSRSVDFTSPGTDSDKTKK